VQVTVKATDNTCLASNDVFYFGNAIGDTGDSAVNAEVNAIDAGGVRDHRRNFLNPATVTDLYDMNRDRFVDAVDYGIVRDNRTNFLNALKLISTPSAAALLIQSQAKDPGWAMLSARYRLKLVDDTEVASSTRSDSSGVNLRELLQEST
jgi:hypothetical protein